MFNPIIKNHVILQNSLIARILVAAFIALTSWIYGWQGFVVAITFWVFWLILQFSQTLRFMRQITQRPTGQIPDAQAFSQKLRPNMGLLAIFKLSQSLGQAISLTGAQLAQTQNPKQLQGADQCWQWRDPLGNTVTVYIRHEKCIYWELQQAVSANPEILVDTTGA